MAYLCQKTIRYINSEIIVLQNMKKYKMRSFRIPEKLDKELTNFSKKKMSSRSKIIKISLKKYLSGGK